MNKVKSTYYNIKYGINNLIKWFPVIWNDRDYEWNPMMQILERKLYNMSILHSEHGNAINSKETAEQLLHSSKLAGRIAKEDYTDEAFGDRLYLMDKNELVSTPMNDGSGNYRVEFVGLTDEERVELMRLYLVEDELLEKDIDELFDFMKKNLRNWWD